MRIKLASPAAGHSAGDTAEVEDDYARWLVANGYATEVPDVDGSAEGEDTEDEPVSPPASPSPATGTPRRTGRPAGSRQS